MIMYVRVLDSKLAKKITDMQIASRPNANETLSLTNPPRLHPRLKHSVLRVRSAK
jgi:hypothetical protein